MKFIDFWHKFIQPFSKKEKDDLRYRSEKCRNCDARIEITDAFCPHCGTENSHRKITLGSLLEELLGGLFAYDGKTIHTLRHILYRPHRIAQEYIAGKRTYVNPFKLFFSISLIFFLFYSYIDHQNHINETVSKAQSGKHTSQIQEKEERKKIIDIQFDKNDKEESDSTEIASDIKSSTLKYFRYYHETHQEDPVVALTALKQEINKRNIILYNKVKLVSNGDEMNSVILSKAPLFFFLAIPFLALIFALFFVRKKELFYMDHLVFLYYIGSATLILLLILTLFDVVLPWKMATEIQFVLLLLYLFVFYFLYYRQSIAKSILKFVMIGGCSMFLISIMFVIYLLLIVFVF